MYTIIFQKVNLVPFMFLLKGIHLEANPAANKRNGRQAQVMKDFVKRRDTKANKKKCM